MNSIAIRIGRIIEKLDWIESEFKRLDEKSMNQTYNSTKSSRIVSHLKMQSNSVCLRGEHKNSMKFYFFK